MVVDINFGLYFVVDKLEQNGCDGHISCMIVLCWASASSVSSPAIPTGFDHSFVSSWSIVFRPLGCNSINVVICFGYWCLVLELFQTHIGRFTTSDIYCA